MHGGARLPFHRLLFMFPDRHHKNFARRVARTALYKTGPRVVSRVFFATKKHKAQKKFRNCFVSYVPFRYYYFRMRGRRGWQRL